MKTAAPDYLLRAPDSSEMPFPETLSRFTNSQLRDGSVDLRLPLLPGDRLKFDQ